MKFSKLKIKKHVGNRNIFRLLVILLFALRAISNAFLAFALPQYSPTYANVVTLVVYSSVFLGIAYIIKKSRIRKRDMYLLAIPVLYEILLIAHTYEGYSGDWITALIVIGCFLLLGSDDKKEIFYYFYWIIQICNIISLFVFFCYSVNIDIGFETVLFYTEDAAMRGYYYQKCGIFAIYTSSLSDRLCGIFNEPGALGTISALLFIATFQYSKLWEKILLIITIIFTYSFAGYLIVFLYLAVHLIKKSWKNVIWVLLLLVFFLVIPHIDWGDEHLNYVASRFEITKDGFAGDNRTNAVFDEEFEELMTSNKAWFGYGAGYQLSSGVSTYKQYIVQYGIVGTFLMLLSWIIGASQIAKKNKECWILFGFFILSLYQRPGALTSLYGYVFVFGGMEWIIFSEKQERENATTDDMMLLRGD